MSSWKKKSWPVMKLIKFVTILPLIEGMKREIGRENFHNGSDLLNKLYDMQRIFGS